MCGVVGFFGGDVWGHRDGARKILERMVGTIVSRGPDDFDFWKEEPNIALAHRRLAIIDLSSAGRQPMVCHTGRYVIVFNGEIYNHLDLRKQLEAKGIAPTWRGGADTETLLASFVAWGIRETVERSVGMFAFAVWDRKDHVLTLARDRLGEKPLYYGWQGHGRSRCFLFGSQVNALKKHPGFSADIDRDALCLLTRYGYIPAPYSIFQGINKLLPGHLLTVSLDDPELQLIRYWSIGQVAAAGAAAPFSGADEQAVDNLEEVLSSAICQQMTADVPVGAFLSGGIDSSLVVALMQAQASTPIKTFTIGFQETNYDEAACARAVARHLGTDHTEHYVTSQQALDLIPHLATLYDEPFGDSSQIPTYLLAQMTRQHVAVSLSGDAGDELFAGYRRYILGERLWSTLVHLPISIRKTFCKMLLCLSPGTWDQISPILGGVLPRHLRAGNMGQKIQKLANLLPAQSADDLHLRLMSHWNPRDIVVGCDNHSNAIFEWDLLSGSLDQIQRMMVLDSITYLPDDILVKMDRASMGVSLESRMPLLDHRVVEFAWHLPHHMKVRDGVSKWVLREVLYRYVPKVLIDRPKMGFSVPIGYWLRDPLRDWAETLLDVSRLKREGYFDPQVVQKIWSEHISGRRDWGDHLWIVLMFQTWLEIQK